jgi:lipoprotein NlpI
MRLFFPAFAVAVVFLSACGLPQPADLPASPLKQAEKAVKDAPNDAKAHMELGTQQMAVRDLEKAEKSFTKALELDPKLTLAQDFRGDARLKLGRFTEAIADFDAFLKEYPRLAPKHWRRGIALYYAGKYEDGVKQFALHKTDNPQDVENAAWHYLCNVKVVGKEAARKSLIDVTQDSRVPMAEIQKMFAGSLKPEDVLATAEKTQKGTPAGTSARFYGNLYVALWYEAEGDAKKVKEHLTTAVENYQVKDYMWDVGHAHLQLLKAKKEK